jgi:hypothetical protein
MTSLAEHVQTVALRALGADPRRRLQGYQPALRGLRAAYQASTAPDFADPATRAAYVLAYHPHHCVLSAVAIDEAGEARLGIHGRRHVRVVVLGAGPAPELVALAWRLRWRGVRIEAHLVDREPGWVNARKTTLDRTLEGWGVELDVHDHTAHLDTPEGRSVAAALVREADLVIVQTLLSELPTPDGRGSLLDALTDSMGSRTRLLVVDFDRLPRTRDALRRLDTAPDVVTLCGSRSDVPAAPAVRLVAEHLFADDDLWPRQVLRFAYRLVARTDPAATPSARLARRAKCRAHAGHVAARR